MISYIANAYNKIGHSPIGTRFLTGAAWSLAGAVISSGANLIAMIFIARDLGKEPFGQLIIVQSTLSTIGVFAGFGIGSAATKYIAELRTLNEARLGRILALTNLIVWVSGLLMSALLLLNAEFVATTILVAPALTLPLSFASLSIIFSTVDSYQKCALVGFEATRSFAIASAIGAALSAPLLVACTHFAGLEGAGVAFSINAVILALASRYQLHAQLRRFSIKITHLGSKAEWPVIRNFALPSLIAGAFLTPAFWLSNAILANTHNGYAELAVLGVSMQWFSIVLFAPSVAGRVVLPILTDSFSSGNNLDTRRILKLAIISNLAVATPLAIVVSITSPWIVSTYGAQFHGSWPAVALAATIAILVVGAMPVGQVLAATGQMWLAAAMNLAWAIIYVTATLALAKYGAFGVVSALGIAYVFHSIWVSWYALRQLSRLNASVLKSELA